MKGMDTLHLSRCLLRVVLGGVTSLLGTCILSSREALAAAEADAAKTTNVVSAAPPDMQRGDYIHLRFPLSFQRFNTSDPGVAPKAVCLPKGTKLEYLRQLISTEANTVGDPILEFRRSNRKTLTSDSKSALNVDCKTQGDLGSPKNDYHVYRVMQDAMPPEYSKHFGITHGALFVPFKRRPDNGLSGESSIGYFAGYRFDTVAGLTLTPIVTAGVSLVNVDDDSASTVSATPADTGVRPAFTWGGGLVLTHLGSFQIGVVYGVDKIGGEAGKNWAYEGKGWYSLMIGYSFTR